MRYMVARVYDICDDKGQVIFESLSAEEFENWYSEQIENGFDFTGWTVEGMDITEFVEDELMIQAPNGRLREEMIL